MKTALSIGKTMRKQMMRIVAAGAVGAALPGGAADSLTSSITSWNVASKQFIDPPVVRVLPLPGASQYRAMVRQGDRSWSATSKTPILDLAGIWHEVKTGRFSLILDCLSDEGGVLRSESSSRVKAPDFKGFTEPPANWAAAADRNIAYLIHAADHAPAPYRQTGVPVWIWSAYPGYNLSYPCITVNALAWAFLAHIANEGPQRVEALRLARAGADWVLEHRQPNSGALPLFPYSTVTLGKLEGGNEGNSVNLLRASWLAIAFVDLYEVTRHEPYLAYARHIADVTVRFQNADGSFPYRVDPKTGAVVEQYNCGAMEFVELVEKLDRFGRDVRRSMAAQRALEWLLAYVCTTHNWKAAYEDVGEQRFYANLSQMAVMPLIRHLCRHQEEDPSYLSTAMRLNRWVEDQFVTFGPDNEASPVRARGPLVFEQFVCWYPMEGHTANWILALIELHKASGKKEYLDKAKAAANAICAAQWVDGPMNGQFSTFGRDHQTGKPASVANWYNANASADRALYALAQYVRGQPAPVHSSSDSK